MKEIKGFLCQDCYTFYETDFEADNCCGCVDVTTDSIYECEACGQQFEMPGEAKIHEAFFCVFDSCRSCRHLDNLNGQRYEPCPKRGCTGNDFTACNKHERATR